MVGLQSIVMSSKHGFNDSGSCNQQRLGSACLRDAPCCSALRLDRSLSWSMSLRQPCEWALHDHARFDFVKLTAPLGSNPRYSGSLSPFKNERKTSITPGSSLGVRMLCRRTYLHTKLKIPDRRSWQADYLLHTFRCS